MIQALKNKKITLRWGLSFIALIALSQIIPALLNGGGFAILFAVVLLILSVTYGIPYVTHLYEVTKQLNNQKEDKY